MQKQKWTFILVALIYIAVGLLFIVRPDGVESVLCYILAIAVAVLGLLYVFGYIIMPAAENGERRGNGFAIGVLMIFLAIFIVVKQDLIITLVPFLFGVMVLIRGLFVLQTSLHIRRRGYNMRPTLIVGLIIMAFGLFIMLFPLESGEMLFMIIGFGMLAAGVSGIVEEIMVSHMVRKRSHAEERARDMGHRPTIVFEDREDEEDDGDSDWQDEEEAGGEEADGEEAGKKAASEEAADQMK